MPERYVGTTLGSYRVESLIGMGGFAWVYKGYDPALDIPVALKILKPQFSGEEMFVHRFRREASTAAKLRHPNIINIFAVGEERGAVYFVMDYLPGRLTDRLGVMTTLPEAMVLRLGMDVGSALGFAHRAGVIHRDIKADNILYDEHGNAVVADFGIARAVAAYAEQTGTNLVMGTPQYFAPEQARGLPLDGRADIYSLGITLFKAATGELPFFGDDWYETARRHVEDTPPRPRDVNSSISPQLESVILRCMEKEPDDRFQTGDAVRDALAEILRERTDSDGTQTVAVPVRPRPRSRRSILLRRRLAHVQVSTWVAVAAVLVLLKIFSMGRAGSSAAGSSAVPDAPTALPPAAAAGPPPSAAAPPGVTPASLTIVAPRGAQILIDGKVVGTGSWTADSFTPRTVRAAATVATVAGCAAQRDSASVVLQAGRRDTIQLRPRGCGRLMISGRLDGQSVPATYEVRQSGTTVARGTLPLPRALVLPQGEYDLEATVPAPPDGRKCSPYIEMGQSVRTGQTDSLSFAFLCLKL